MSSDASAQEEPPVHLDSYKARAAGKTFVKQRQAGVAASMLLPRDTLRGGDPLADGRSSLCLGSPLDHRERMDVGGRPTPPARPPVVGAGEAHCPSLEPKVCQTEVAIRDARQNGSP